MTLKGDINYPGTATWWPWERGPVIWSAYIPFSICRCQLKSSLFNISTAYHINTSQLSNLYYRCNFKWVSYINPPWTYYIMCHNWTLNINSFYLISYFKKQFNKYFSMKFIYCLYSCRWKPAVSSRATWTIGCRSRYRICTITVRGFPLSKRGSGVQGFLLEFPERHSHDPPPVLSGRRFLSLIPGPRVAIWP